MAEGITDIMKILGDISDDVDAGRDIDNLDAQNLNEKLTSQGFSALSDDQMKEIANKMIDLSKKDSPNPADVTNTAEEIAKILTGDQNPSDVVKNGVKNSLEKIVQNIQQDRATTVNEYSKKVSSIYEKYLTSGDIKTADGQAKMRQEIIDAAPDEETKKAITASLTEDASKKVLNSVEETEKKVDPKDKGMWQKIKDDIAENWGKYTLVSVIIIIGSIIAADEWQKYKDANSGCYVTKTDSNGKVISHCKVMSLTCGDGSSDTSQQCQDPAIAALKCNSTSSNVTGCTKAVPTVGTSNNSLACSAGTIQNGFASIYCDDQYMTTSDGTYTYHFHAEQNSGPIADLWNDFTKFFNDLGGDLGDLWAWLKKWGTYIGIGLAVIIGIWVIYSLYSHFSGGGSEKVEFVSAPAPAPPPNHFRARTRMNNY